MLKNIKNVT